MFAHFFISWSSIRHLSFLSLLLPSWLIFLILSHNGSFVFYRCTPPIEILLILSVWIFLHTLALVHSPAVPGLLCAFLHPLSPLSLSSFYFFSFLAHFLRHTVLLPMPHSLCFYYPHSFLLLFILECCLSPKSSTAPPLTLYPSFAKPHPFPLFSPLHHSNCHFVDPNSFYSFFLHLMISSFSLHIISLPALMNLFFLHLFSTPPSLSSLFSPCLCGLQAYLPPRRQAAVGEVWKPALSRLSDLPRRASCLTSKGNE